MKRKKIIRRYFTAPKGNYTDLHILFDKKNVEFFENNTFFPFSKASITELNNPDATGSYAKFWKGTYKSNGKKSNKNAIKITFEREFEDPEDKNFKIRVWWWTTGEDNIPATEEGDDSTAVRPFPSPFDPDYDPADQPDPFLEALTNVLKRKRKRKR